MEADLRQAEKLLRDFKLDGPGVKAAASPGVKATREQLDVDQPLEKHKATPYRAVVARANYLAADRPELQFPAKEVCRWMSSPTEVSLNALKRLGRYVAGRKRLVFQYPWQTADRVDTYSDTDWAGCPKTRKSTSGGCLMLGRHLIKSWSSTQASVALSSGEAEFYGVVKAGGVSLGYQALLADIGIKVPIRVWTDSSATIGICGRQGLGRLRHVDTRCLWIQQRVRDGTMQLYKVRGEENPADLFTKHLTCQDRINSLLRLFGCSRRDGRAAVAPKIRMDAGTGKGELLKLEAAGVYTMD
jgi:histone deacetylase 1/2